MQPIPINTSSTKAKSLELAHASLLSPDAGTVLSALDRIEQIGDTRSIRPLLQALVSAREERVRQRITSMLHQVKVKDADTELFAALADASLASVRPTILSVFWNAGLDVRDHLERFVTIALEGRPEECLECLTVIESQEILPEKDTRMALARVRKSLPLEPDPYKAALLEELANVLADRAGIGE